MAKRSVKTSRVAFKPLPQIGSTTEQCQPVTDVLNFLGTRGYMLQSVVLYGQNNRESFAYMLETPQKWEYKVVQFNAKDPLKGEDYLNSLGRDGWVLVFGLSQGANFFASAAIMIRPIAELVAGPERVDAELDGDMDHTEEVRHVSESFATASP